MLSLSYIHNKSDKTVIVLNAIRERWCKYGGKTRKTVEVRRVCASDQTALDQLWFLLYSFWAVGYKNDECSCSTSMNNEREMAAEIDAYNIYIY